MMFGPGTIRLLKKKSDSEKRDVVLYTGWGRKPKFIRYRAQQQQQTTNNN